MYPDPIDFAADLAERERQASLTVRKPTLARTGYCHACGEPLLPAAIFCDAECREQYERMQRLARINGRPDVGY